MHYLPVPEFVLQAAVLQFVVQVVEPEVVEQVAEPVEVVAAVLPVVVPSVQQAAEQVAELPAVVQGAADPVHSNRDSLAYCPAGMYIKNLSAFRMEKDIPADHPLLSDYEYLFLLHYMIIAAGMIPVDMAAADFVADMAVFEPHY